MKKIQITFIALSTIALLSFTSCSSETETKETAVEQDTTHSTVIIADTFKIDTTKSSVKWKGQKVLSDDNHYGTIAIKEGAILLDKSSKIVGGTITIDMNKIVCTDEPNPKLIGHLKNNDFFATDSFPSATFTITSVKDSILEGQLTIKGKTLPYSAKYTASANKLVGSLEFNRQQFGVNYQSPSLVDLGNIDKKLKEKLIKDEISIDFELVY